MTFVTNHIVRVNFKKGQQTSTGSALFPLQAEGGGRLDVVDLPPDDVLVARLLLAEVQRGHGVLERGGLFFLSQGRKQGRNHSRQFELELKWDSLLMMDTIALVILTFTPIRI